MLRITIITFCLLATVSFADAKDLPAEMTMVSIPGGTFEMGSTGKTVTVGGLRTTETCSLTSPLGNLRGSSLRRAVPPIYQVAPTPYFRLTTSGAVPAIVGERRRFYSTETISAPSSFRLKKPGVRRFVFLAKKDRRMRHRTGVSC